MKKEVAEKLFKEKGIVIIPHFKKIWYSITKFEKYPEMAAEGVGRAILYLTKLILLFAIIMSVGLCIRFNIMLNSAVNYVEKNVTNLNYENGNLTVELSGDNNEFISDTGTVLIDTEKTSVDRNFSSSEIGIVWLKDHVSVSIYGNESNYYYKSILDGFNISNFDKSSFIGFLNNILSSPQIYIAYFIFMLLYMFMLYFIITLLDIIMLSIFGVLTSMIANIKMRYRAVFNMSVYAITISVILELIYMMVNLFVDFEVKYFDLMYTAIAYICLAAAIFMIKSDVIKQHIELMRIIQNNENKKQEEIPNEENKKEEKKETDNEKKEDDKKEKKDKELNDGAESQGSNA